MGKSQRDKGARNEVALVNTLKAAGLPAARVPLSGALGGEYAGDITIAIPGGKFRIEAKLRSDGFKELYKWLDGNDAVVVRADRKQPLAVVPLETFIAMFQQWRESGAVSRYKLAEAVTP